MAVTGLRLVRADSAQVKVTRLPGLVAPRQAGGMAEGSSVLKELPDSGGGQGPVQPGFERLDVCARLDPLL
jgi:hypothetical protein